MRGALVGSVLLSFSWGCLAYEPPAEPQLETGESRQAVTSPVEAELQASFNDAACFCQDYVLETAKALEALNIVDHELQVLADRLRGTQDAHPPKA